MYHRGRAGAAARAEHEEKNADLVESVGLWELYKQKRDALAKKDVAFAELC